MTDQKSPVRQAVAASLLSWIAGTVTVCLLATFSEIGASATIWWGYIAALIVLIAARYLLLGRGPSTRSYSLWTGALAAACLATFSVISVAAWTVTGVPAILLAFGVALPILLLGGLAADVRESVS